MKYNEVIGRIFLYFSAWSKKGYSIFVSLGREVKIARLSLHMYSSVLLKASAKGVIINTDHISKVVLPTLKKEIKEALIGRAEGEMYPNMNNLSVTFKGYIA